MRFRRRPSPLVLLLLPSLAAALAAVNAENIPTTSVLNSQARDSEGLTAQSADPPTVPRLSALSSKFGSKGTKDAPVDGKDGKPHAGPWVDLDDRRKAETAQGDSESIADKLQQITNKPSDPSILDWIPQSNDGVMDDPKRESPKAGTTGTEGGITEKDKARKAKEGQTGERLEKIPDPPKEALPAPDQPTGKESSKKISQKDSDLKDATKEENDEGLGGLEASFHEIVCFLQYSNSCRNQLTSRENHTMLLIPYQTLQIRTTLIYQNKIQNLPQTSKRRKKSKASSNPFIHMS